MSLNFVRKSISHPTKLIFSQALALDCVKNINLKLLVVNAIVKHIASCHKKAFTCNTPTIAEVVFLNFEFCFINDFKFVIENRQIKFFFIKKRFEILSSIKCYATMMQT
jgi:hypothetical protein